MERGRSVSLFISEISFSMTNNSATLEQTELDTRASTALEALKPFLKKNGIRTHVLKKISENSDEIPDAIRQGHIAYVINTKDIDSAGGARDGQEIRKCATENNVNIFTALDTVGVLLDVLEETTLTISTIDA